MTKYRKYFERGRGWTASVLDICKGGGDMVTGSTKRTAFVAACGLAMAGAWGVTTLGGQTFGVKPAALASYTAPNPYERFPDGRPRCPTR